MKNSILCVVFFLYFFLLSGVTFACSNFFLEMDSDTIKKESRLDIFQHKTSKKQDLIVNALPILKATGDQIYCPQTSMPIVTDITITDSDDTSVDAIYIQISIGYNEKQDLLTLTGNHPTIVSKWDSNTGKLKLSAPINGVLTPYTEFIAAIKDVVYTNSSLKPTGNRSFSISIDKANYLPTNNHFYEFVEASGITWGDARIAAETQTYFGLKGYLATVLSAEEGQIIGQQLPGTGWIGGSDYQLEGEWRWLTGPENGTLFWSNLETGPGGIKFSNIYSPGYTPNFAFWNRKNGNNNEPDNGAGFENFAHIIDKDSELGLKGSWIDLTYNGTTIGTMKSRGYIVEYGGMPEENKLPFATSTSLTIPQITKSLSASRCDKGEVILEAATNLGGIEWYEYETGGVPLATGNQFTTPSLLKSTTYYVENAYSLCAKRSERTPVTATIYNIPIITTSQTTFTTCGHGEATLSVNTNEGTTYWYEGPSNNSLVGIGTSFTRNFTKNASYYVEAVNNGCSNGNRIKIDVIVYDLPPTENQEVVICTPNTLPIETKLSGEKYLWSTAETTKTINVNTPGIYTVAITRPEPESCTITETITVIERQAPKIKQVNVEESTITIILNDQEAFFEYSIDGINYQKSNVISNVSSGIQTAYVRDESLCNLDTKSFIVIITPKFFTPNNDGVNDAWEVQGIENYPDAQVKIVDRFGKWITTLNAKNFLWDGTLNKNPLPASDYWYVLKLDPNSPEKRGHFTLKR